MFRLNDTGFQMDLPNGYTISVQFSPFAMCSNRKFADEYGAQLLNRQIDSFTECRNAETAVKDTVTHEFIPIEGEDVQGYQTVNDLIRLMNDVRDYPNTDAKMAEVKERAMSNA